MVDERLSRLRLELDDHTRIAERLGLDLERPLRSLSDGYPENAITLIGKLTEKLLKQLWRHHQVPGDPAGRALNDLIKGCRPHIRSSTVIDAFTDIQRLRNRSSHDGYEITDEDGLLAVRRLVTVLAWFTSTAHQALTGGDPHLAPEAARRTEFLSGLYITLGYRVAKRFVLSQDTVYQLFCRESGVRLEYVELLLSTNADELGSVLDSTGGELLRTRLPKVTRFVILDDDLADTHGLLGQDYRCVRYEHFVGTLIDLDTHLAAVATAAPVPSPERAPLPAALLTTDPRTGESRITDAADAEALLAQMAHGSANVLVIGRPGSGKSTLLRTLVTDSPPAVDRHRFYFDLSLKAKDETFAEYVARTVTPRNAEDRDRAFALFLYLVRSGSALCVLDAIDEAVDEPSPAGFLRLFADLAPVLSAESSVVMSSRVAFLADSPQVRGLLDHHSALSEQLVEQMYAGGVDPDRMPHISVLRLIDDPRPGTQSPTIVVGATPLERKLSAALDVDEPMPLGQLLARHIDTTLHTTGLAHVAESLAHLAGRAFTAGRTVFPLLELHNVLGPEIFRDGRIDTAALRLAALFRPVGTDAVAFLHSAYQELLTAHYLAPASNREQAAALPGGVHLTEQVRAFLSHHSTGTPASDDCVLPVGVYLVGPPERLLLRRISRPVRFDRHPVTVARYRRFLEVLNEDGTSDWDHPNQPAGITHTPWTQRLRVPDYYRDPRYDNYPAVCVNWWSAYAFAAFENKRLPTSLEWEAAARGTDGRLFPWGDTPDLDAVNCVDAWVGRPIVTYQAWKAEYDRSQLADAWVTPVEAHTSNRSPYGIRGMVGNVWEWTCTSLNDPGEAVICGGSYDNPLRAVQTSAKALYRRRGSSNVVGFRLVQDLPRADWSSSDE
ncbi:SUMF1/EgtB/PvdO family nonheme iron enzyme [Streptomyces sp. 7N604]|uniref:SUMF1/EgtB/PvdO family nonheme iron enzyme n=1 Tax=Streptomyces sp. 7N604 TaxID=3457415 RepID=UPI003FCFCB04